ncbi:3-hydroxyisobutyrate dehydrogenase [Paramicrobacterium humi]|uniref:3-hydroxyisobutyrate dehydrogenase n=1 Tax=Paramicrobacterium humi TaxID=640635 RepID=A0A1H4LJQ1_9MICO|nr:NAD(P)-dependent oxidoreductase [Microbacterium humi]SEB70913.1 3-hydroxyisobutyrate dehydrogenase [Microbacterium humi]
MSNVTFVGIGAIGLPMAVQLSKSGHTVTGVDPFAGARERAVESGIDAVESIADAPGAETVVVMVATPEHLETLVSQAGEGVSGQTWVIMSTVGPASVREQGEQLIARGARVVDAPVTGGVARAKTGELVIFVSGDSDAIAAARPALDALGTARVVGANLGDGQGIKVVNQHLAAVHIAAAAEALNLAESLGLDKGEVLDLVKDGAAGSWMLSDRGPRMLMGTDAPVMSTIGIFVKDSGLVADAAAATGAEVPLLDAAKERYRLAADAGLGARDDSRVIETYQHRSN